METKVVKLDIEKIDFAKINEAVSLIDAGGLVAFPTETVYGIACRVKTDSLARLDNLKRRNPDKRYTLHIGEKVDVKKYVPTLRLNAQKLIQNAWPGPLTIVFELEEKDVYKQQKSLEIDLFENLYTDNSIGIRCPDNLIAANLLRLTSTPVVAPSANVSSQSPAVDADQVLAQLSGQIELLLDAGPCKYKKSSTVVKMGKRGLEILRHGVYSQTELEALLEVKFLFVCTGNTCRSPMAEGMFRKYLAEKLQCNLDELERIGYKVRSAGIIGSAGFPATAESVTACAAKGIDIKAHRNKGLTNELIRESDIIFVMERLHRDRIIGLEPKAANRCLLLAGNKEIPDPIGHPQKYYNTCAKLIEKAVKKRIGELVI
jgi:protein-tyrosine phosphatase